MAQPPPPPPQQQRQQGPMTATTTSGRIDRLRSLLEAKPGSVRLLSQLAALLHQREQEREREPQQPRGTNNRRRGGGEVAADSEARGLAARAAGLRPDLPHGHWALSVVAETPEERMAHLARAVDRAADRGGDGSSADAAIPALLGLARLLLEPRQEERAARHHRQRRRGGGCPSVHSSSAASTTAAQGAAAPAAAAGSSGQQHPSRRPLCPSEESLYQEFCARLDRWEQRRQGSGSTSQPLSLPRPLPDAGADPRLQDLAAREYAIGMMFRKMAAPREAGPPAATRRRQAEPQQRLARDTSPQLEDLGALRALYRDRCARHLASSHRRFRSDHPARALAAFWLSAVRGGGDREVDHGGCGGGGGSGADEERHGHGGESDASVVGSESTSAVTRCPPHYVVGLYSTFAPRFDDLLVRGLGYRTPQLLRDLVDRSLLAGGGPREFCSGLDLGCGTGLSGMAFRDRVRGWWRGVDLSPEMLDVARRRGSGRRRNGHGGCYDELIVGDATSPSSYVRDNGDGAAAALPSAPVGTWDLVLACDVLVYLGDLEPVFALAASHLAPGRGAFALSTELLPDSGGGGHGPSPAAPSAGGPVRPPRDYRLLPTGRFAHSVPYLRRLASRFGLGVVATRICPLRRNGGRDVLGCLAVLERNGSR